MAKKKKQKTQTFLSEKQYIKEKVRGLEIGKCYWRPPQNAAQDGMQDVIITRLHKGGNISVAVFLVDMFCLGVKDTYYEMRVTKSDVQEVFLDRGEFVECSYDEAHNMIYGAIEFAEDAGIKPHPDFALTQYFLQEDTDDIPLISYDYGKNGEYFFVADSTLELNRFLPTLEKNLGKGNFKCVVKVDSEPDDDEYDDDDEEYDDAVFEKNLRELMSLSPEKLRERLANSPFAHQEPQTEYAYQRPIYPSQMSLTNSRLFDIISDRSNQAGLSDKELKEIASMDRESLCGDLEKIVMNYLYRFYNENEDEDINYGELCNSLILLGEYGSPSTSLDVVIEVLRQNNDFYDYCFGDFLSDVLAATIFRLADSDEGLEKLNLYMREPGLYTYNKVFVSECIAAIAYMDSDRRDKAIGIMRGLLEYAISLENPLQYLDGVVVAFIVSSAIDLGAIELMKPIKRLFDMNRVDITVCGNYEEVEKDLLSGKYTKDLSVELNIRKIFDKTKSFSE